MDEVCLDARAIPMSHQDFIASSEFHRMMQAVKANPRLTFEHGADQHDRTWIRAGGMGGEIFHAMLEVLAHRIGKRLAVHVQGPHNAGWVWLGPEAPVSSLESRLAA